MDIVSQHPVLATVVVIACIVATVVILVAALLLGRSLKLNIMGIHAELKPNGGSSVRDAVDRIEIVVRDAVKRIEKLEQAPVPSATAIVVTPPTPEG